MYWPEEEQQAHQTSPMEKKRLDESIAKITTSALKMHVFFLSYNHLKSIC